jgi:hypothetical protein
MRCKFYAALAAIIGLSVLSEFNASSVAQDNVQLMTVANLIVRKGLKDTSLGQTCDLFHLRHPVGGSDCKAFSVEADDNDLKGKVYPKGWYPGFFTYFEQAPSATRVILSSQDKDSGFLFLLAPSGDLDRTAVGRKINGKWEWSPVPIIPDLQDMYAREVLFWTAFQQDLEKLPDRKD